MMCGWAWSDDIHFLYLQQEFGVLSKLSHAILRMKMNVRSEMHVMPSQDGLNSTQLR